MLSTLFFCLTFLPFLVTGDIIITNNVCLLLDTHSGLGYGFTIVIFIMAIYFTTLICHILLLLSVKQSREKIELKSKMQSDTQMTVRVILTGLSNIMCWSPIFIISILDVSGVDIPQDTTAWITITVLPLNSLLNPFIFTLNKSRLEFLWSKK